jgi:hypothetical protein
MFRSRERRDPARRLACAGTLILAVVLPALAAAEIVPELSVNWSGSDNIQRSTTDPGTGAQTLARAGIDFFANRPSWNLEARAAAERVFYSGEAQNDDADSRYGLYLRSEFLLVPERVTWEVLDDLGLVATDSFGELNPSDLQEANLFSTGPNLYLPVGISNRLEAELRYSRLDFSGSDDEDNNRYSATVALLHSATPIRNIGVALSRQRVMYAGDDTGLRNYNLDSAFFVVSSAPRRSAIVLQGGYSRVDDGETSRSGPSGMIAIERRLSETGDVAVFARTGYADAADSFRFGRSGSEAMELVPQNVQATSAPFRQTIASLEFRRRVSSTQITFAPVYSRERFFDDAGQSRRAYGVILNTAHALGPSLQLRVFGNATENKYDDGSQDSTDYNFGAGLTFQFSRSLALGVDYDRFIRSGVFRENRISAVLRYRPPAAGRPEIPLMNRIRGVNGVATSGFRPEMGDAD